MAKDGGNIIGDSDIRISPGGRSAFHLDSGHLELVCEERKTGTITIVLVYKKHFRYTLAGVEGVGAAVGLYRIGVIAFSEATVGQSLLVLLFFAALYTIGILTAVMTVRGHVDMVDLTLVFWGAQIPSLVTNVVTYRVFSGVGLYASAALDAQQLFFVTQVGSNFVFSLGDVGWEPRIGVNLLGVVVFGLFLWNRARSKTK